MKKHTPHPAPGCHRAGRPWHPVRLLGRHDRPKRRTPRRRRPPPHPPRPQPFPQSARYIADMKAADGKTMTIGISVDGDRDRRVRLQRHRRRSLVLRQPDRRQDRHQVAVPRHAEGRVRRQRRRGRPDHERRRLQVHRARRCPRPPACTPPTSTACARPGWCVPTARAIGVQFNGGSPAATSSRPNCSNSTTTQFRAQVRNKRNLQQAAADHEVCSNGSCSSTINGTQVTPTLVNGNVPAADTEYLPPNGPAGAMSTVAPAGPLSFPHAESNPVRARAACVASTHRDYSRRAGRSRRARPPPRMPVGAQRKWALIRLASPIVLLGAVAAGQRARTDPAGRAARAVADRRGRASS